jgi:hypothetical protein
MKIPSSQPKKIWGLKDKMGFGKYAELTVEELIKEDPDYLAWAADSVDWFSLDQDTIDALDFELFDEDPLDDHSWHEAYDYRYGGD